MLDPKEKEGELKNDCQRKKEKSNIFMALAVYINLALGLWELVNLIQKVLELPLILENLLQKEVVLWFLVWPLELMQFPIKEL